MIQLGTRVTTCPAGSVHVCNMSEDPGWLCSHGRSSPHLNTTRAPIAEFHPRRGQTLTDAMGHAPCQSPANTRRKLAMPRISLSETDDSCSWLPVAGPPVLRNNSTSLRSMANEEHRTRRPIRNLVMSKCGRSVLTSLLVTGPPRSLIL